MKKVFGLIAVTALSVFAYSQGPADGTKQSAALVDAARDFIKLYNTGDTVQYRQLLRSAEPDSTRQQRVMQGFINAFNFIGPVETRKIQPLNDHQVLLVVQDKQYDSWWNFNVTTDSLNHFKSRTIMPVGFTSEFIKAGRLSNEEISRQVDDYILHKLGDKFRGNVFIAHDDSVIYSRSFGNDQSGKPNNASTLFGLASMGKLFTSVSILQLRDEGKLSLDDTIAKYITLKRKDIGAITIRQLLSHTSGMGDFFESPLYEKLKDSIKTASDWLPVIEADQLRFEPGKGWAYSNTGFTVLGIIIEKVSGQKFEEYVQKHIFKPAGMNTAVVDGSAGGGEATIADLDAFSNALTGRKLLSPSTTQELFTYTVNEGKYGLGSEHQQLGNDYVFGHSGGFMNVCTELNLYLKSGYKVIILSNVDPPFGHFLSNKIKELLVRK